MAEEFFEITSLEDIELLNESSQVECKLAGGKDGNGELPKDFWPTYSAFANTKGGSIFLGLHQVKTRFHLEGILNIQKVKEELWTLLENREKVSVNLLKDDDVEEIRINNKTILHIRVPQARRKDRPVYIGQNPMIGTYVRINTGDHKCNKQSVQRMLVEQIEDERDAKVLVNFGLDDIDMESLAIYRNMLSNARPSHPFLERDGIPFLKSIRGYDKDRETGHEGLTLAGLLMFGRFQSIQNALPNYFVDYQEKPSRNDANKDQVRWIDRVMPDGTWSGNIFDFYRRVYPKLVADLKIPFKLNQDKRQDETPIHIALREALVNTLVHADYSEDSGILIIRQPRVFGFSNPGKMRIPIRKAIYGGESDCRNKIMLQMFLLVGLGERAGSGLPKIYSGWTSQHWRRPRLYEVSQPNTTRLVLQMLDLFPEGVISSLQQQFGDKFTRLDQTERSILANISVKNCMAHKELSKIIDLHPYNLSLTLRHLVKDKFLISEGKGRGTIYFLPGQDIITPEQAFGESDEDLSFDNNLEAPDVNSGGLDFSSGGLSKAFHAFGVQIEGLNAPLIGDLSEVPSVVQLTLQNFSKGVREERKSTKKDVESTVLRVCHFSYIRLSVISQLLGRSGEYLRKEFLNPLVASGRLKRAFPTKPNDPRQAYMSVSEKEKE